MKSLYLIDISSFIFRAYYAVRPLSTKAGVPVNAVYGVVSMMNKLIETKKPDHLIVCYDRKEKGVRHEMFPAYKANRSAPPEDLVPQFDIIKEFIEAYPIKTFDKVGYEADDVIATLVKKFKGQPDIQIFIVSSDKDLMQLVDDNVFVYDSMKEKINRRGDVIEKFGVPPEQVVEVQALSGDSVDNIPGIAGVGPKTATKLIQDYGTVENVIANADKIQGKIGEKIREGKDSVFISKKLVSLVGDLDLAANWEDMELAKPNVKALNEFYNKLEFKKFIISEQGSFLKDAQTQADQILGRKQPSLNPKKHILREQAPEIVLGPALPVQKISVAPAEFILVSSSKQLEDITRDILAKKIQLLAFDTETDAIDSHQASLVGISFCYEKSKAYYVPIAHREGGNLALNDVARVLGPILTNSTIGKLAQNAKFDLNILVRHDLNVTPLVDDTMIASYLCEPEGQHNLDFLADKYLNYTTLKFSDVVPKDKTFADVSLGQAARYSAEDSWVAFSLNDILHTEIKEKNLNQIYSELEIPLVGVLATMEQQGVLVDKVFLDELHREFTARLKEHEKDIYRLAGKEFNINSTKQLAVILFDELKLPVVKKTKTGFSTDVDVLTELAREHELPAVMLKYRLLTKLLSTYVEQLKNLLNPITGRVHTSFNQTIAATGRLSSTEPNLQNIPIKTEEGKRIRKAFIAPENCVLMSFDYSQIELRLLAAFSKDPHLIHAYQHDEDIHAKTAAHILGVPLDKVDSSQRAIGKTINFGVVYGQSPYGLAQQLGVPQSEAKFFIEGFYREFSKVHDYKEIVLAGARINGFVTTYLGRRRYVPDILSKNFQTKQNAERVAFNSVFQGSAADLIKKAMIEIQSKLVCEKFKSKMILQVHDELIFEVPNDEREKMTSLVTQIMESAFDVGVPLKVSVGFGKSWAACE